METQEPYYISAKELEDSDALLSGVPDIEVHLPSKIIAGHKNKLYERDNPAWIKLSTTFRDKWLGILQGSKLAVFLAIALHIDENGKSFPGIELISKETGYSERQIIRSIQQLEKQGLLDVTRIYMGNKVSRNFYNVKAFVSYGYNNPVSYQSDILSLAKEHQSDISDIINVTPMSPQVEPVLSRTINMQEINISSTAKKTGRTKEELMKGTEEAYLRSLNNSTSDYAHIPEHARPWIQKVCELWNLKPPGRKAKDLGYWITGANDLQDACSEFGIDLLTDIHTEWRDGFQNGCAPWTINAPNSLVKTARGKAGMKRQGISGTIKQGKPKYHSLLDV